MRASLPSSGSLVSRRAGYAGAVIHVKESTMTRRGLIACVVLGTTFLGLVLPLVLYAQVQEVRLRTVSRMRNCVFAVHNFHDTYRTLPPAFGPAGIYLDQSKSAWFHLL